MAPRLNGNVLVGRDPIHLLDALAGALLGTALEAVDQRGAFHLALSGGGSPQPFYQHLVIDPRYRAVPWDRTHVWIVDERRVPPDDERSNGRMIREVLTDHIPARRRQVHPVPVDAPEPDRRYEAELIEHVPAEEGGPPRLDFVLLGMGSDGHTASLFPGSPALAVRERLVTVNEGPTVTPPPRVTMTFPLLNAARFVAVLVTGQAKAAMLERVDGVLASARTDPLALPITGVHPDHGHMAWYLDRQAAGEEIAIDD